MAEDQHKSSKRKREPDSKEELEIDMSLPEPLSKKDLRKAKKTKVNRSEDSSVKSHTKGNDSEEDNGDTSRSVLGKSLKPTDGKKEESRGEWGIWIGNIPWSIGKAELREFFCTSNVISDDNITRIHMPQPPSKGPNKTEEKPKNKGFAYVDFDSFEAQEAAIKFSDTFLQRRRVLIKQAKSFLGRPMVATGDIQSGTSKDKPPSKRIFVGNLGFDVSREDMKKHFSQCGEVEDVFLATFEDSGKCKGFGWVTFQEVDDAKKAVRGWIEVGPNYEDSEDEGKQQKRKKKKVNCLEGRLIRCEFAEAPEVRFKKRFSKSDSNGSGAPIEEVPGDGDARKTRNLSTAHEQRREARKVERSRQSVSKMKPSNQPIPAKATGAIVASTGKTTVFD
jgi:RNA recognition motif-containing protein